MRVSFLVVLIVIVLTGQLVAQQTNVVDISNAFVIDPVSNDARSRGMGYTEIMSAKGSNSMFANPAHLATLDFNNLQFGGRVWFGSIEDEGWDDFDDLDVDSKYDFHTKFTHLSFAMPYKMQASNLMFAFGLGYNTLFDYGADVKTDVSLKTGDSSEKIEITHEQHGGLSLITPSMAINIADKYYFGLTLNKSIMSNSGYEYREKPPSTDGEFSGFFDHKIEHESNMSASFLTLGGLVKLNEQITTGFMYRSGFDISFEDISTTTETYGDPASTITQDREDYVIAVPAVIGIGISFSPSESLTIAGEYQTRAFSDVEIDGAKLDLDSGNTMRFGCELGSNARNPIRLGYFSNAIMLAEEGDDKPISKTGFTFGIGFNSKQYAVNIFGEYAWLSTEYLSDTQRYKYEESVISSGVSLSYFINQ